MPNYDNYNREERAICSHLFRLLHEKPEEKTSSPLGLFIFKLFGSDLSFQNGHPFFTDLKFENVAIYTEVALIRDFYYLKKGDHVKFMDLLTEKIKNQEEVTDCPIYSNLKAKELQNIRETHPNQIKKKWESLPISFTKDEKKVYGALQGMFNAKPDLVITIDDVLFVCEAKFTEPFDDAQIRRTENIAKVWASLLFKELGFIKPPVYTVFKLGNSKYKPNINWNDVLTIAEQTYPENDRTRIAIHKGVDYLGNKSL
jgi:hypothetical protein